MVEKKDWLDVRVPDTKVAISIRIDSKVLDWYKNIQPYGYQTLMNGVLRRYMELYEQDRAEALKSSSERS